LRKMKRLVSCWGELSWLPLMPQVRGHEWGTQDDEWATRHRLVRELGGYS
jgi:hypothetical protein